MKRTQTSAAAGSSFSSFTVCSSSLVAKIALILLKLGTCVYRANPNPKLGTCVGETGVHWDTGSIGTPPLVENLQHTEPMRCHFMDAWEPPLYKSIRTKKIMQYKKVGK